MSYLKPRNYTIFFSLYGKKMKTTITAYSQIEAKQAVLDSLKFDKITVENNDSFNQVMQMVEDMSDMLKGSKKV